jgi:DNA-binding NtrC family response regulator
MCKDRLIPLDLIRLPEPAIRSADTEPPTFDDDIPLLTETLSASQNGNLLQQQFIELVRQLEPTLNETQLAEQLGISRKTLWERRKTLGIPRNVRRRPS